MIINLDSMYPRQSKIVFIKLVIKLFSTDIFGSFPPQLSKHFTISPNTITSYVFEKRLPLEVIQVNLGYFVVELHGCDDFNLCANTCDEMLLKIS